MRGFPVTVKMAGRSSQLLAAAALAIAAPVVAQASVVENFVWVPISENPTTGYSTPSGTLQLTLSSFALTGPTNPPNFGPYYASGNNAATANITGFSYTAGDGLTVNLSNVTAETVRSTTTPWQTSGLVKPATGAQAPTPPPLAYYLISGFTLSGKTSQGSSFMIANNVGTAGATYANGVGNGGNTFNAAGSIPAITDGGYWKLVTTPVPLPAALPLLLSGIGGLGALARRRKLTSKLA